MMVTELNSKNLVPFKRGRNGYHLPGGLEEAEGLLTDRVDHDLSPEEQGFVRHYLSYADQLLRSVEEREASPVDDSESGASGQPNQSDEKAA
jgi:hypothetical protein